MNPDENTNTIENSIAHLSPIDKSSGIKIMPLKSTDTQTGFGTININIDDQAAPRPKSSRKILPCQQIEWKESERFQKYYHGKRMPINDKAFESLKQAIDNRTKNDVDKLYLDYFPDAVVSQDLTVGREPANLDERKMEIFTQDSPHETILKDLFIKFGIDNVFGKAQSTDLFHINRPESSNLRPDSSFKKDKMDLDLEKDMRLNLVDTKITTHHIENNTFFVLTGFKKGIEMVDKNYAQGVCVLQVYKLRMENIQKPLKRIYYKELSDYDFDYYPVKNMKPITFNGNAIWFYVFDNTSHDEKITRTLYKYNMSPDHDDPTQIIGESMIDQQIEDKPTLGKQGRIEERQLVGVSVSFSSAVPRGREVGETEFKRSCYATFYYMAKNKIIRQHPETQKTIRKERYCVYITRGLAEPDVSAAYKCEQFVKPLKVRENWSRLMYEDGDLQEQVLMRYKILFLERDELWHKREFKSTLEDEMTMKQIKNMQSRPYLFCFRQNNRDKSKLLNLNEEQLSELPQIFGIESKQLDSFAHKNNFDNVLQSINLVDETNLSQLTVIFYYNGKLVYQRYKNERYGEYPKYNYDILGENSKFVRYRGWGKRMYEKYDNLYIQVNQFNQRWVYLKINGGDWIGGHDEQGQVFTDQIMNDYLVFDWINGEKKYDVPRIESGTNNREIRFKIKGGHRNGIILQLTDYDTDEVLTEKILTDDFSADVYNNVGIAWSSQQYTLEKHLEKEETKDYICQNLQWSQLAPNKMHAYFFEYRIIFKKYQKDKLGNYIHEQILDPKSKPKNPKYIDVPRFMPQIQLIRMKDILMSCPYEGWGGKNWFFPAYDSQGVIIGTQWIPTGDDFGSKLENNDNFFRLINRQDSEFTNKTLLVKSMYRILKMENNEDRVYICTESAIGEELEKHYEKFTESEIFTILNDETRTTLNMVPCDQLDIISMNFHANQYDPWQPLEILGGQCIADYFLNEPKMIKIFCDEVQEELLAREDTKRVHRKSIIERYMEDKDPTFKDYFDNEGILRQKHDTSQDFLSSNPLRKCFDFDIGMSQEDKMKFSKSSKIVSSNWKHNVNSRLSRIKEFFTNESEDKMGHKDQQVIRLRSKHLKSAQYIVTHILHKKNISIQEQKIIMTSMKYLLQHEIDFGRFFENIYENGQFAEGEDLKNRYCNMVEMNDLPEFSKDKAIIRKLGQRKWPLLDIDDDKIFLKRVFKKYNTQKNQKNKKQVKFQKQKINTSQVKHKGAKIGVKIEEQSEDVSLANLLDATQIEQQQEEIVEEDSHAFFEDRNERFGERKLGNRLEQVSNFMIDYSSIELEIKRNQLLSKLPIKYNFNLYELTREMNEINQQYKANIENCPVLQQIINALFHDTKQFFFVQMIMFLTYMIPFFMQILLFDHHCLPDQQIGISKIETSGTSLSSPPVKDKGKDMVPVFCQGEQDQDQSIIVCNIVCLIVALIFFVIELVQMHGMGKVKYFQDFQNRQDFSWFFVQFVYCIFRIVYVENILPLELYWTIAKTAKVPTNINNMFILAIMNTFLIFYCLSKMMFFMTVYKNFGTMIRLVQRAFQTIQEFLFYFFGMICILSAVNKCLGYDIGEVDGNGVFQSESAYIWNYFVHTFLNSVGGIERPQVEFWTEEKNKEAFKDSLVPIIMTVLIWVSWMVTVVVLFIILCNFMISYISQTYEDVLEKQIIDTYVTRCDLNNEYYVMLKFIGKYILRRSSEYYNFNCFLITADFKTIDQDPDSPENTGLTKKIKLNLEDHKILVKNQILDLKGQIEEMIFQTSNANNIQIMSQIEKISQQIETTNTRLNLMAMGREQDQK